MATQARTARERTYHINSTPIGLKSLEEHRRTGAITDDDARLIQTYIGERRGQRNLSQGRVNKILFQLLLWRRFVPPFRENTIQDLYSGLEALRSHRQEDGSPFSKNTLHDTVAIFKPFYRWMIDEGISPLPEKKLTQIRTPPADTMTKTAASLLTKDEVEAMIRASPSSRDRALIAILAEGGLRIGEAASLTWGEFKFDEHGAVVNVNAKTEKPRWVRFIAAVSYLAAWKADYPGTPENSQPVFVSERKGRISYQAIYKQIRRIAKAAGVQKKVTPHIFRHTAITNLIRSGVQESVIKKMMWGSLSSEMLATYLHMTGEDIDQAILEAHGLAPKAKKRTP
ncbi:MAG: site-specific integrase, partial [Methanomicrobiales archaeon]|nr:site-specific integrase [Methanomicrobiales archaeon]